MFKKYQDQHKKPDSSQTLKQIKDTTPNECH